MQPNTHTEVELIRFIIKSLTGLEEIDIARIIDERGVFITVTLPEEAAGRVIGKRGATAQSIRTILRALGTPIPFRIRTPSDTMSL